MFSKSLIILLAAISLANVALGSPHSLNRRHHNALAARGYSATRNNSGQQLVNRALRKRCRSRPPPTNASNSTAVDPPPQQQQGQQQQQPPPPPSSTTPQQAAQTQAASDNSGQGNSNNGQDKGNNGQDNGNNGQDKGDNNNNNNNGNGQNTNGGGGNGGGILGGLPSFVSGILSGEGTFYNTGLTACGQSYSDNDAIVAVSKDLFDIWPGAGANPNLNPICNKKIRAHYEGNSVDLTIVDRCEGCKFDDIDMTPSAFSKLADQGKGRLSGVTWEFIA